MSSQLSTSMSSSARPFECSSLCHPATSFATKDELDEHTRWIHGPTQEVSIGGLLFKVWRTNEGYVCPKSCGAFAMVDDFYSHLCRCRPGTKHVRPTSLPTSWETLHPTASVASPPVIGNTKSGRAVRPPDHTAVAAATARTFRPARSRIPLPDPPSARPKPSTPKTAQRSPAASSVKKRRRGSPALTQSKSNGRLRPSGARRASTPPSRSPELSDSRQLRALRRAQRIPSETVSEKPNGRGATALSTPSLAQVATAVRKREQRSPSIELLDSDDENAVASSSTMIERKAKVPRLDGRIDAALGRSDEKAPSKLLSIICADCPEERSFRTLDALYNHRVDVHGDQYRFTLIDGHRFITPRQSRPDDNDGLGFCSDCQSELEPDLVVLQGHAETCKQT